MGSSVLEDARQRPTAAKGSGGTRAMDAALSQSPPEAA